MTSASMHAPVGSAATERPEAGVRRLGFIIDLSITAKIMLVVCGLGLMACLSAYAGVHGVHRVADATSELADSQKTVATPLAQLSRATLTSQVKLSQLVGAVPEDAPRLRKEMKRADAEAEGIIAELTPALSGETWWGDLVEAWGDYRSVRDDALPLLQRGDVAGFIGAYQGDLEPIIARVDDGLDAGASATDAHVSDTADAAQHDAGNSVLLQWLVLGFGLVVCISLGVVIAMAMKVRLLQVQRSLAALAEGDLTTVPRVNSRDEVGVMAEALVNAQNRFRAVIAGVASASDAVATSSEQLTTTSVQIAAAAEETAQQAGLVATASEQVAENVQTVATGAEEMDASIREIARNANDAARVAASAVEAAEATTARVERLGVSSAEIGKVVNVITSIAEQTNLLALNATIEAARAGDMGKGFAVVANEVKELASETAKATEEIVARIQAIQADTAGAVEAIGEIAGIIATINESQLTIASAVDQQSTTTNEMGRNVSSAAEATGEITSNISGVAAAAQSTTEAVVHARNATDELARMAAELRERVGQFTY